jgi:Rit1 N-terminal domain
MRRDLKSESTMWFLVCRSRDRKQVSLSSVQVMGLQFITISRRKGSREFAYFKSTDGHFGRWDFNLRRSNLHLIPVIERYCGYV